MLQAGRFEAGLSTPSLIKDDAFRHQEGIGLRWNVETGGLTRAECIIRANSGIDAYMRYSAHLGQRVAFWGRGGYRPVSGVVREIKDLGSRRVMYVIEGPMMTYGLAEFVTTIYGSATAVSTAIYNILANMTNRLDNADQSNIETNSTTTGGWQPPHPGGGYPLDLIRQLLLKPDSAGSVYYFWLLDEPFTGVHLNKWIPYYHKLDATHAADWVIPRKDMRDPFFARSIANIRTSVVIFYGTITGTHSGPSKGGTVSGTHDGSANSATLDDSTANFVRDGVKRGDVVTNTTDGCVGVVASVTQTKITLDDDGLTGGTDNDFDAGDGYSIKTHTLTGQHSGSANSATLADSGATFFVSGVLPGDKVENFTDGCASIVQSCTATTITFQTPLQGGTDDDFDSMDYYILTQQKTVEDSTRNFQDEGVKVGDVVTNITDGSRGTVTAVYPTILVLDRLSGGTDNRFDNGDTYSVEMQDPQSVKVQSTTSDFWTQEVAEFHPDMTATQAEQYAKMILDAEPEQLQAFTITAPMIQDGSRAWWPLYEMILQGGGYIQIPDLYPAAALATNALNRKTTFFITAMDYDNITNTMRVAVDRPDRRLDAQLRREGIISSEIISRGDDLGRGGRDPGFGGRR